MHIGSSTLAARVPGTLRGLAVFFLQSLIDDLIAKALLRQAVGEAWCCTFVCRATAVCSNREGADHGTRLWIMAHPRLFREDILRLRTLRFRQQSCRSKRLFLAQRALDTGDPMSDTFMSRFLHVDER